MNKNCWSLLHFLLLFFLTSLFLLCCWLSSFRIILYVYVFLALASIFSCLLFTIYNAQCKLSHIFYIFFHFPFQSTFFPCTFLIIIIHFHFVCMYGMCVLFWLKFYFYNFKYFFEANSWMCCCSCSCCSLFNFNCFVVFVLFKLHNFLRALITFKQIDCI